VGAEGIAWEAHIGGFFCGLLAFGFFDRDAGADAAPFASR
jgi:membrane associated rhomboid family serine protease